MRTRSARAQGLITLWDSVAENNIAKWSEKNGFTDLSHLDLKVKRQNQVKCVSFFMSCAQQQLNQVKSLNKV